MLWNNLRLCWVGRDAIGFVPLFLFCFNENFHVPVIDEAFRELFEHGFEGPALGGVLAMERG